VTRGTPQGARGSAQSPLEWVPPPSLATVRPPFARNAPTRGPRCARLSGRHPPRFSCSSLPDALPCPEPHPRGQPLRFEAGSAKSTLPVVWSGRASPLYLVGFSLTGFPFPPNGQFNPVAEDCQWSYRSSGKWRRLLRQALPAGSDYQERRGVYPLPPQGRRVPFPVHNSTGAFDAHQGRDAAMAALCLGRHSRPVHPKRTSCPVPGRAGGQAHTALLLRRRHGSRPFRRHRKHRPGSPPLWPQQHYCGHRAQICRPRDKTFARVWRISFCR
jgi:hypothetical protein